MEKGVSFFLSNFKNLTMNLIFKDSIFDNIISVISIIFIIIIFQYFNRGSPFLKIHCIFQGVLRYMYNLSVEIRLPFYMIS